MGKVVTAEDDDRDMLTYTLGGADADMFRVRSNGQIEVSEKAKLNYEDDTSHTVTLTADDGVNASNSTATITVTIYVTDVDEAPTISDRADSSVVGEQTVSHPENDPGTVATFTALDPEGVTPIGWTLLESITDDDDAPIMVGGFALVADDIADADHFDIDAGELTFNFEDADGDAVGPDYEMPRGEAMDGDNNTYKVVVQASDGGTMDTLNWFKVTVMVMDVEEDGKVSWTVDHDGAGDHQPTTPKLMQFQVGASLMASVADDDGDPSNVRWQWYRSSSKTSMGTEIEDATTDTYTVTATPANSNDVGNYIHVKATYNVDNGSDETASLVSDYQVQAARNDNSLPVFASNSVNRRVTEGKKGMVVGAPVIATDADRDVLNYTLAAGDDADLFRDRPEDRPDKDHDGPGLRGSR